MSVPRFVGGPWTRSVVGVGGPGVSVFGLPHGLTFAVSQDEHFPDKFRRLVVNTLVY